MIGRPEVLNICPFHVCSLNHYSLKKKKTPLRGNVRCVLLYQNALLRCSLVLNGQRQPRARARAGASTSVKSVCTDCSDFFFFFSLLSKAFWFPNERELCYFFASFFFLLFAQIYCEEKQLLSTNYTRSKGNDNTQANTKVTHESCVFSLGT